MQITRLIICVACSGILLSSCVSKKKYLDMESSKLRAEQRVRDLTTENNAQAERLKQMIADYEQVKTDLMASNAEKDELIGKLNGKINNLSLNVQEKDASIEEKIYAFAYEKRRLNQQVDEYKQQVESLSNEKQQLTDQVKKLNGDLAEVRFDLNRQKEENTSLEHQLNKRGTEIEKLSKQLSTVKAEVQQLKVDMQTKDETIERLKNNVSLLKNEIGK